MRTAAQARKRAEGSTKRSVDGENDDQNLFYGFFCVCRVSNSLEPFLFVGRLLCSSAGAAGSVVVAANSAMLLLLPRWICFPAVSPFLEALCAHAEEVFEYVLWIRGISARRRQNNDHHQLLSPPCMQPMIAHTVRTYINSPSPFLLLPHLNRRRPPQLKKAETEKKNISQPRRCCCLQEGGGTFRRRKFFAAKKIKIVQFNNKKKVGKTTK